MCCESGRARIPPNIFTNSNEGESGSPNPVSPVHSSRDVQNVNWLTADAAKRVVAAEDKTNPPKIYIAPQPMCQFKAITSGFLDRVKTYLPSEAEKEREEVWDPTGKRMNRRCLCDTIWPILKLSQYVGVVPLSIYHPPKETGLGGMSTGTGSGACQLIFQWKSFGAVANTVLTVAFLGYLPFSFIHIKNKMGQVFDGTDLYAFTLQTVAMILETTVLLFSGRFLGCKFMKGWAELNEVYHALCDSAEDLQRIKASSYIATMIILLEMIVFCAYSMATARGKMGIYQGYWDLAIWNIARSLTLFIPYTLSTLFLFICLLIRSHFLKISEMLEFVVKKPNTQKLHVKIDTLRVLHEQLCQAVSDFETFFGIQILLTLCTGCFTVTTGAYASIIQGEGISTSKTHQETGAWAMQMYSAAIFMLLILIAGQLMTNAASSPAPVLNSVSFVGLDANARIQVQAFLQKISAFPTKMSALKITNVSTTFLASAATNITTYLLVLMQFKLSLEKATCGNGSLISDGLDLHLFSAYSDSHTGVGTNNTAATAD